MADTFLWFANLTSATASGASFAGASCVVVFHDLP
jgi:hypothetical protein